MRKLSYGYRNHLMIEARKKYIFSFNNYFLFNISGPRGNCAKFTRNSCGTWSMAHVTKLSLTGQMVERS